MIRNELEIIIEKKKNIININKFVNNFLESFRSYRRSIKRLNDILEGKAIRSPNFPSEISENVVRLCYFKKYGVLPDWSKNGGDIETDKYKFEVKAFLSNGPTSFGPSESLKGTFS